MLLLNFSLYVMRIHILLPFILAQQFISVSVSAQQAISIDLGAIRAKNHHHAGMNLSGFYHFNEHVLGGVEVNRFFPIKEVTADEKLQLSGWDLEMNFHYLMGLSKTFKLYPIGGVSHTIESEINTEDHRQISHHSWAVNTGVGLNAKVGHWLPHVEYIFSWGELKQEFILIGAGYEISWGHHKEER